MCPTPHLLLVTSNQKEKGVDFQNNKRFTTDCCLFPELEFPLEGYLELVFLCRCNTGENHWVDTTCFYLEVTVSEQFCLRQLLPALFAVHTFLLLALSQWAPEVIATILLLTGSMEALLAVAAWQPVPCCVWQGWGTQFLHLKIVLTAYGGPESSF